MILKNSFYSMAGFAMKAGKLLAGGFACEKAVKSGKAFLYIADSGMSEGSYKSACDMCRYYEVPIIKAFPENEIGQAVGKYGKKSFVVTDRKFAERLLELYNESEQAEV